MSEYQYYEFLAIDHPLSISEVKELRKLSTRAEINSTRFTNTYNWGDFGGSPSKMMEKYFDAHVYVANWGTNNLMLRLPIGLIDEELLRAYCIDDPMSFSSTKDHIIISWNSYTEEPEGWVEGKGWMSRLIRIRDELESGDYRSLYIGWLLAISQGLPDDDTVEPIVPPGMSSPTAAQKSLVEFLHLDEDLVAAAASASEPLSAKVDETEDMRASIEQWRDDEMKQMLLQVLRGEFRDVQSKLRQRYNQYLKQLRGGHVQDTGSPRRTVPQLFELVEEARRERKKREELKRQRKLAAEERKRRSYLAELAKQFPETWKRVEALAEDKKAAAYERAVELLVDLSDAYDQEGRDEEFRTIIFSFATRRKRQSALIRRMKNADLELPF